MNNFNLEMYGIINKLTSVPKLLLHCCCAPCATTAIERLSPYFEITLFYYNPNIFSAEEYAKRADELSKLSLNIPHAHPISLIVADYRPNEFLDKVKGLENQPERGARCDVCYAVRLTKTAELAKEHNFDYFATTLTLSPLKNAIRLNTIGYGLEKEWGMKWLPSDFKKENGYKRSIELSTVYNLYRQNFCGCIFSRR